MFKAIFFDLDGTLVNTLPLYISSYNTALEGVSINLSPKEIVTTCFGKTEDVICKNLGIPEQTKKFTDLYFSGVENHYKNGELFNGVIKFLESLKAKNIKLAVISFAYSWYVLEIIKRKKLNRYFEVVIGFNDVTKPKPDPEAVIIACHTFNIRPQEVLVVGDSKSDILMGKNAGTKTALFHPKEYNLFYSLNELKAVNPDIIAGDFYDLMLKTSQI